MKEVVYVVSQLISGYSSQQSLHRLLEVQFSTLDMVKRMVVPFNLHLFLRVLKYLI